MSTGCSTVAALGTSFGRGGSSTYLQDLQHADCILIEGSNFGEAHPVGFQWVMEAKRKGATVIHVDPRFSRTSALADIFVPIRAGTDIAWLSGLINYVLSTGRYFHDYVLNYTNAATLVSEDFQDTEDLDGLFSGLNTETRHYDPTSWMYDGAEVAAASGERDSQYSDEAADDPALIESGHAESYGSGGPALSGRPHRDETLQHPRCVLQILKRHFARYTPELVQEICGVPPELFAKVAHAITENSGRERTTAFAYAVGWTQHTTGVQYIRTASILQLLLGNIGRPGGGIMALRGHASIQGSSDIPTLFDLLPGYIRMPHAHRHETPQKFVDADSADVGFWHNFSSYLVSLLKAWWGPAATREAHPGARRHQVAHVLRRVQALHARRLFGRLPDGRAVSHRVRHCRRPTGRLQRLRLLRVRLPVRRHRPTQGRRAGLQVRHVLRPHRGRPGAGLRQSVPGPVDPVRRARHHAGECPAAG